MSLDYEFAPIDVGIITHDKLMEIAEKHRAAAFGLWTWGQCYARFHKTGGHLKRAAIMTALALSPAKALPLLQELVRVGLWTEREDLSIDVHNFEKKAGSMKPSAKRMRDLRARRRAEESSPGPSPSLSPVVTSDVTNRHQCSYSPSPSLSPSGSQEEIQEPEAKLSARANGPPPWFAVEVVGTLATNGVTVDDVTGRWLEYESSRIRKGWAMNARDAVGWLTSVLRSERARAPVSKVRSLTQSGDDRCYDMPAELR